MTPGIYQMPADTYHADPCPAPSLSASIAHRMLTFSPWHAWCEHPRLNPDYQAKVSEQFDLGTAGHSYLLQGATPFAIIEAPDWRTKAAKEAREAARLAGHVPILAERWTEVQAMVEAARRQLMCYEDPPLRDGHPEQTLIWQEHGTQPESAVWCRARLDWLRTDQTGIEDYKTTGQSANPDSWGRTMFGQGAELQAAFYLRGLRVLTGSIAAFRFIVQENFPPYALSVIGLGPDVLMLAEKKRFFAVNLWRECLLSSRWPGYPTQICHLELPGWEEARWLEKEVRDGQDPLIDDGRPLGDQLAERP